MALSSAGIGSGLDVETIVSKLVALEKQPLNKLQTVASSIQSKISLFSQVKSLMSTLADAATRLTQNSAWSAMSATSSNTGAVQVSVSGAASATSFSVGVAQLARAQSVATAALGATNAPLGGGTLSIQLGGWTGTDGASPVFNAGAAAAVSVQIDAADTLSAIATKINAAKSGLTATVLRDANGERLLLRSDATGKDSGFRIQVAEDGGAPGLSRLSFDPEGAPGVGIANAAAVPQYGQNAKANINGIAVESATNTFTDTIPGLTFTASQVTGAPVEVAVSADTAGMKKAIQDFVTAYNSVNDLLSASTKYDEASKKAGLLQADSTSVGLQNSLRAVMGTAAAGAGVFERLSDIGIDIKRGGKLEVAEAKLDAALRNPGAMQSMFAANSGAASDSNGLAVKVKAFTARILSFDGLLENKATALGASKKRNSVDQDRVNDRAAIVEKRLRAQYTALDAKMGSLTALNNYIGQQVSQWNKSSQ